MTSITIILAVSPGFTAVTCCCLHCSSTEALLHCCTGRSCAEGEYRCLKVFQCIPLEFKSDGKKDCMDGSDETGHGESLLISQLLNTSC